MSEPRLNYVQCPDAGAGGVASSVAGHRMAYWEWGDPASRHVVVCVHGLTRQGRDFDLLAQALAARAPHPIKVVCPDVVGRGMSDWLPDPLTYQLPSYVSDMVVLLQQLEAQTLDWVGTSMGGLIGMVLCGHSALHLPVPVRRLVLNDVGPVLQWDALQRIASYLGTSMAFESLEDAAAAMAVTYANFGPHTSAQWLQLCRAMVKPSATGTGVTLHYDPAIAAPLRALTPEGAAQAEMVMWQLFDAVKAKTLVVRGAQSDLLSAASALQMAQRGPKPAVIEFSGVGHAPTLVAADQIDVVASFLLA